MFDDVWEGPVILTSYDEMPTYKYHVDICTFTYEHEALVLPFLQSFLRGEQFQNVVLFLDWAAICDLYFVEINIASNNGNK